jgi:hypothetical protein
MKRIIKLDETQTTFNTTLYEKRNREKHYIQRFI